MPLLVRRLKVMDLPALEQIEAANMKRYPGRVGWLEGFRKLVERTLREEPEGLMIAELNGRVVGSAIVRRRGVHPYTGLEYGHIFHLSVAPDCTDPNVATRLLRECEAYFKSRGCEMVHVLLPADNLGDAEMFKRGGYGVAAWELRRSLK